MRREIRALQRRLGMTMLYVTHDQVEAMTMADQVVLMRNGRIEQDAAPAALYERPATIFAARFVGTPPMNVMPAALLPEAARQNAPAGHAPDQLAIGIRPEAARIGRGRRAGDRRGGGISRRRHADRDAPRGSILHRAPVRPRERRRPATLSTSGGSPQPRTGSICRHNVVSIDKTANTPTGESIMDRRKFLAGTAALAGSAIAAAGASRRARRKSRSSIRSRSAARSPKSSTAMRPTSRRPIRRSR